MPLYFYRCPVCGATEELQRPVALRNKPMWCLNGHSAERMERPPQTAGISFRGPGFFVNDYPKGEK